MIKKSRKILTLLTLVLSVSLLLCALAILPHAEGEASLTPLENQSGVVAVTAIAGDQSSNTSEGYAKLTDGRNEGTGYTKWCTPFDTTNGAYVILQATAGATQIQSYTFVTGNDTADHTARNPKSWTLYGSNDYGAETAEETWTVIATETNNLTVPAANFASVTFRIPEPADGYGSYQYYKFHFTELSGTSLLSDPTIQLCAISLQQDTFVTAIEGSAGNVAADGTHEEYTCLFDGKKTAESFSKWCISKERMENAYVVFRTKEPVVLNGYAFVTGNDNSQYSGRNPKSWTLYGSYNYNETTGDGVWNEIHTVTDDTVLQDVDYTRYIYEMSDNHAEYQYYKLVVATNKGGNVLQLSELELCVQSDCTHSWTDGTGIAATCNEPAYTPATCATCGATKKTPVTGSVALGHDWGTETTDAPTCTVDGVVHEKCSRCDETRDVAGESATGHDWQLTRATPVTCAEPARSYYTCGNTGCEETKQTVPEQALGHVWGENGLCLRCASGKTEATVGAFTVTGGVQGTDYTFASGVLKILTGTPLTIANTDPDTATTNRIYINKNISANLTLAGVNINVGVTETTNGIVNSKILCALEIAENSTGDVTLTLAEGKHNFLMSGALCAGIQKMGASGSLTIRGKGSLEVYGGPCAPGIGTPGYRNASIVFADTRMVTANITVMDCTLVVGGSRLNVWDEENGKYKPSLLDGYANFSEPAPAIGVGKFGQQQSQSSDASINIPGHIRLINANVTAYSVDSSAIGAARTGKMTDVQIIGGSLKWIKDGRISLHDLAAVGGYYSDRNEPRNASGEKLFPLTVANPNGECILIDGEYYGTLVHSATDKNVYVYLTGEDHTVLVGSSMIYTYQYKSEYVGTETSVFSLQSSVAPTTSARAFTVTSLSDSAAATEGTDYTYEGGVLKILTSLPMRITSNGVATTDTIEITSATGAQLTLSGLHIDVSAKNMTAALAIAAGAGDVTLTLEAGSVNIFKSGMYCAGIQKPLCGKDDTSAGLLVNGTGELYAAGGYGGAGIGSWDRANKRSPDDGYVKNITVAGGRITAIGGDRGAGIGGGALVPVDGITVSGGTVLVVGGTDAAGIGSGQFTNLNASKNILISGGVVSATGGKGGAGIGGGYYGEAAVSITGGVVLAVGGEWTETAVENPPASIGGGTDKTGTLTISGGSVRMLHWVKKDGAAELEEQTETAGAKRLVIENPTGAEITVKIGNADPVVWVASSAALGDTNLYLWIPSGEVWMIARGSIGTDTWHNYGDLVKCQMPERSFYVSDEDTHWFPCVDAGEGKCQQRFHEESHTFDRSVVNEGYLKSAATCTEAAVYYKSCTCGAKGGETDTFTDGAALGHVSTGIYQHTEGESTHKEYCSRCKQYVNATTHAYTREVTTTEYKVTDATCTAAATYYKSCVCGARSSAIFASTDEKDRALGHAVAKDAAWEMDASEHWKVCSRTGCGAALKADDTEGKTAHRYVSNCAGFCEDCGYDRRATMTANHTPATTLSNDMYNHWYACTNLLSTKEGSKACGAHVGETDHTYKNNRYYGIEYYHYTRCDTCDYFDTSTNEEHDLVFRTDDNRHWKVCTVCDKEPNEYKAAHTFDNACDTTCNGNCGYTRLTTHQWDETTWHADETEHWHECTVCHDKKDVVAHQWGMEHDADSHWEKCTCGETQGEAAHSYDGDRDPTCNEEGCSYRRKLKVPSLSFGLSGYEVNGRITDIKISLAEGVYGVQWDESFTYYDEEESWYYWWIVTDLEGELNNESSASVWGVDTGSFLPGTAYWLAVDVYPEDDYTLEQLAYKDVVLEGVGSPCYAVTHLPNEYYPNGCVTYYFRLPLLAGKSTAVAMPELDITVSGYKEGKLISDVLASLQKDLPEGTLFDFYSNYTDNLIDEELSYQFYMAVLAPAGYTFAGFTEKSIHVIGASNVTVNVQVSAGGGYISVSLLFPPLSYFHVHDRSDWHGEDGYHFRICFDCYMILDVAAHEYDGAWDDTCNVCGEQRELCPGKTELVLGGYEVNGCVKDMTLAPSASSAGYIVRDYMLGASADGSMNSLSLLAYGEHLQPGYVHYVIAYLLLHPNFIVDEIPTAADFTLAGYGHPEMAMVYPDFTSEDTLAVILMFKLPALEGEFTHGDSCFGAHYTVEGYAGGSAYNGLFFTPSQNTAGVEGFSYTLHENNSQVDITTGSFDAKKNYVLTLTVKITSGYSYAYSNEGTVTLKLKIGDREVDAKLNTFWIDEYDGEAVYVFDLPLLDTEHEHNYVLQKYTAGHTEVCSCGARRNAEAHIYESATSTVCTKCHYGEGEGELRVITKIVLELKGYTYGSMMSTLTLTTKTPGVIINEADYGEGFALTCDLMALLNPYSLAPSSSSASFFGAITPPVAARICLDGTRGFYIVVRRDAISTADGFMIYPETEIVLEGAIYLDDDPDSGMAIYALPVLEVPHLHGGEWVDEVPATCMADGVKGHYTCTICGKDFDDENNELTDLVIEKVATAHKLGEWVDEVPATCTADGVKGHYTCAHCGKHFDAEGNELTDLVIGKNAAAHKLGEWVFEIPATTESAGVKGHADCVYCGKHFDAKGAELSDIVIEKLKSFVVSVSGGSLGGDTEGGEENGSTATVDENGNVTVVAGEPEKGERFAGWYDQNGNLVSRDETYSFRADADLQLDARYEPVRAGMSGGAIVAISVASVLLLELGGFALFWFVIRKRSLGDLLAVFRKK